MSFFRRRHIHLLIGHRWAYLGLGFTIEDRTQGADQCPYLNEEVIDPKWMEVIKSGALVVDKAVD
jgi:hypothetical protein